MEVDLMLQCQATSPLPDLVLGSHVLEQQEMIQTMPFTQSHFHHHLHLHQPPMYVHNHREHPVETLPHSIPQHFRKNLQQHHDTGDCDSEQNHYALGRPQPHPLKMKQLSFSSASTSDLSYQDPLQLSWSPQEVPVSLSVQSPSRLPSDLRHPPQPIYPNHFQDMTSLVNSDLSIAAPVVESTFVDHTRCSTCGKKITRDMTRHMRTHQLEKRFKCLFPKSVCLHKSGLFNRRYDFKKHLLNKHFMFDDPSLKRVHNLRDKLHSWGTCPCGQRFISSDWLDNHILTKYPKLRCVQLDPLK